MADANLLGLDWGPTGRPAWAPERSNPAQVLAEMAAKGPPISIAGLEAAPNTLTAQVPSRIAARARLDSANSLGGWNLLASRLGASPVNALSPQEVAASPATPPMTTAGNLAPASPLASSVALMALAAAGTHKFVPVDYDPFKQMQAAESQAKAPAVTGAGELTRPVNRPAAVTGLAPVQYVTKTGMRSAYSNPELNLASG